MTCSRLRRDRRPALATIAAAAAVATGGLAPAAASAQQDGANWYLGVRQGLYMDDNVYMAQRNKQSDVYGATSLLGGFSVPLGRQRARFDGTVTRSFHSEAVSLGTTTYNLRGSLDFETIERISGTVSAWAQRSRGEFGGMGLDYLPVNNNSTSNGIDATIRKGVVTRLTLEGRLGHRQQRYSRRDFATQDSNVTDGSIGFRYRPAGSLVLGASLRLTQGEYPRFTPLPDGRIHSEGFKGRNIDFSAMWPITGASTVNALLSIGKKEYDNFPIYDYSGVTGQLSWDWAYSGRTQFRFGISRDTGTEPFAQVPIGEATLMGGAATQVRDTLSALMNYQLTGKSKLRANLQYSSATQPGRRGLSGREQLMELGVGVTWQYSRPIAAGCDLTHRQRLAPSDYTYTSNKFGCWAEFVIR